MYFVLNMMMHKYFSNLTGVDILCLYHPSTRVVH